MLPGFRFLFAAIMLSVSLLVFGLGATALLRSAHEEFANNPSWRGAPEVKFAQPAEPTMPVLATLRVDIAEQKPQEDASPPATASEPTAADPVAVAAAPAQPAEVPPDQPSPAETAEAQAPTPAPTAAEASAADETPREATAGAQPEMGSATKPADGEEPARQAGQEPSQEIPITSTANTEPSPRDDAAIAVVAEESKAADETAGVANPADLAATKIATLGGPPVEIKSLIKAGAGDATADESAAKQRAEAKRAAKRRRIAAARAKLAAQQAQQAQRLLQAGGPFFAPPARALRAR
jgi:hypothetical protein